MKRRESFWGRCCFIVGIIFRMLLPPLYSFARLERYCKARLIKNPRASSTRLFLAHLYKDNLKYQQACQEFEILFQEQGQDISLLKVLGEVYFRLENYAEVVRCLEPVTNRFPDDKLFNFYLGASYMYLAEYEKAFFFLVRVEDLSAEKKERFYELPEKLHFKKSYLYQSIGRCCFQLARLEEAVEWYRKALEIDPSSIEVRNNTARAYIGLANILLKEEREEEAIAQFRLALEVGPEDSIIQAVSDTLVALGKENLPKVRLLH